MHVHDIWEDKQAQQVDLYNPGIYLLSGKHRAISSSSFPVDLKQCLHSLKTSSMSESKQHPFLTTTPPVFQTVTSAIMFLCYHPLSFKH